MTTSRFFVLPLILLWSGQPASADDSLPSPEHCKFSLAGEARTQLTAEDVGQAGALKTGINWLPLFRPGTRSPAHHCSHRPIEGHVVLSLTVSSTGSVLEAGIVEAIPRGYYERAAIRAAEKSAYTGFSIAAVDEISGVCARIEFACPPDADTNPSR